MTEEEKKEDRIRKELERCRVVQPARLSGPLGVPTADIQAWLDQRVAEGKVKLLRPIGCLHRETDYYRLIRKTDDDHLWQQELHTRQATESAAEKLPTIAAEPRRHPEPSTKKEQETKGSTE